MNIAIDCRYLGKSGIGRVCQGILENLDYDRNNYFLVGKKDKLKDFNHATIIENDSDPFSFKGLTSFPKSVNKTCDVILLPNFIVPFGIKIPIVSIMHDLIFLDLKKMTKGLKDSLIKKYLLLRCVKRSKSIACVSQFTKNRCIFYYKKYSDKFFVNYNGLSKSVLEYCPKEKIVKNPKSIVYVGNVKPHKGLKTLIEAFNGLDGYTLKIIGEKDNFITGFSDESFSSQGVVFTGRLNDEELLKEMSCAGLLVQPSEYEGFGIPPLEAMYLGTKPIVSDIDVFKEVYNGFDVDFFKVKDSQDLRQKILSANIIVKDEKEHINNLYSYKICADNLVKILEKVK